MNLTLPLRSITSQCCVALLNSIWLARVISRRPSSCNGNASVQRQWAVPSGLNCIVVVMFMVDYGIEGWFRSAWAKPNGKLIGEILEVAADWPGGPSDARPEFGLYCFMSSEMTFGETDGFPKLFKRLHAERRQRMCSSKDQKRARVSLTKAERDNILLKSDRRCHICGGRIDGADWEADHVFAYSTGGSHSLENYLPAHAFCNHYRWNYGSEEFQWILKLGVWMRGQIENETTVGVATAKCFIKHEQKRIKRRRKPRQNSPGTLL